jgi:hypothetical protein
VTTLPSPAPGVHARITEVTVSAIPESSVNHSVYAVQVQWRGDDRYAVKRHSLVLGADGEWDYEPMPSSREDDWITTHRFGYEEALQRAVEAAPHVTVNGITVAESLARSARLAAGTEEG